MIPPSNTVGHELAPERDVDLCEACAAAMRKGIQIVSPNTPLTRVPCNTLAQFFVALDRGCFVCNAIFVSLDDCDQKLLRTVSQSVLSVKGLPKGESRTDGCYLRLTKINFNFKVVDNYETSEGPPDVVWADATLDWAYFHDYATEGDIDERWYHDPSTSPGLKQDLLELQTQRRIPWCRYFLVKQRASPSDSNVFHQARVTSDSTASNETFAVIGQWLNDCQSRHVRCIERHSDKSWYPTRLLDIGTIEGNVKIVESKDIPNISQHLYVTLSHRWSSLNIPRLTVDMANQWKKDIPAGCLTPTFCDFFNGARRLGIRYAWIDCLCIIQEGDSGSDWARESLSMDKIYKYSYCNFSAEYGSELNGLFFDRDLRKLDQLIVSIETIGSSDSEMEFYRYLLVDASSWKREVADSPLNKRGWVLQERMLSPRVLHFGCDEVYFECLESSFSERFPRKAPLVAFESEFKSLELQNWRATLKAYGKCELTFCSDKLMAIAGIAKHLKSRFANSPYVLGLWLHDLSGQMTWWPYSEKLRIRNENEGYPKRDVVYAPPSNYVVPSVLPVDQRFPSFSWASVDFHFLPGDSYQLGNLLVATSCIEYRCDNDKDGEVPFCKDIFNFVSRPIVEVKVIGCLKRARLFDNGATELQVRPLNSEGDVAHLGGIDPWRDDHWDDHWDDSPRWISARLDFSISLKEIPALETHTFYYMPWNHSTNDTDSSVFLLLELADEKMGRFRRIGIMLSRMETLDEYLDPQPDESDLPCGNYDPNTRKHTIYIV